MARLARVRACGVSLFVDVLLVDWTSRFQARDPEKGTQRPKTPKPQPQNS